MPRCFLNFLNKKQGILKSVSLNFYWFARKLFIFSLASSFRLFLALYAGLLIVFSLAKLGKDAGTSGCTLKATKSAVQGLAFFNLDFCHSFFPPSAYCQRQINQSLLYTITVILSRVFAKNQKYIRTAVTFCDSR